MNDLKNIELNPEFRKFRDQFITEKIKTILNQQKLNNESVTDIIDELDDVKPGDTTNTAERYGFVTSGHKDKVEVKIGDPCFENPCSYESVELVFDHILDATDVRNIRKWTLVGCNGLPYTLGSRIIDNTYACPTCHLEFLDVADFLEHQNNFEHVMDQDANTCRKYNNILMIPGTKPSKKQLKANVVLSVFSLNSGLYIITKGELGPLRSGRDYSAPFATTMQHPVLYVDEDIKVENTVEVMECKTTVKDDITPKEDQSTSSNTTQTPVYPLLAVKNFIRDDAGILFYTCLSSDVNFIVVQSTLGEAAYHLNYQYNNVENLSIANQFFLTLIKLRQHKTNFELSRLFNISEFSVSNILITWVNFMACQWRELDIWPDRDLVRYI